MKVSSDSWHYKILMTEHQRKVRYGTSLCVYFWMVVFSIFAWSVVGTFAAIFAAIGLFAIYATGYVWYFLIGGMFGVETFDADLIEFSFVLNGIFVATWILSMVLRKRDEMKNNRVSFDNLFFEYVRAKKQRICPLIEFEE